MFRHSSIHLAAYHGDHPSVRGADHGKQNIEKKNVGDYHKREEKEVLLTHSSQGMPSVECVSYSIRIAVGQREDDVWMIGCRECNVKIPKPLAVGTEPGLPAPPQQTEHR